MSGELKGQSLYTIQKRISLNIFSEILPIRSVINHFPLVAKIYLAIWKVPPAKSMRLNYFLVNFHTFHVLLPIEALLT